MGREWNFVIMFTRKKFSYHREHIALYCILCSNFNVTIVWPWTSPKIRLMQIYQFHVEPKALHIIGKLVIATSVGLLFTKPNEDGVMTL